MSEFQHDQPIEIGDLTMYRESGYWYAYRMQGCGHVDAVSSVLIFPASEDEASPVIEAVLPFRPKCRSCQEVMG